MDSTRFALSDDELLDALATVDDASDSVGFPLSAGLGHESLFPGEVAFLQDNGADADDAASTDSSSGQSTLLDAESAISSPTKAAKPSRKRRKHELEEVRALASSLEQQLEKLKQHRQLKEPGVDLFWKRVADELLLERQRAASENGRLKHVYQDQTKLFKAIQKIIQKSPDLEKLGVIRSPSLPVHENGSSNIYSQLFRDSHSGMDPTLERSGVGRAAENKRQVNMKMRTEDGRSVMTVEVAESKIVPFHVSTLGESVWGFLGKATPSMGNDSVFKAAFQDRGNDVFGVCKVACSLGLYTFNADAAVRRLVDGNKLTYVWECVGRCDNKSDPSSSFGLQEKGWVMFEPSPTDPLHQSVYKICVHFTPRPLDASQ